MKRHSIILFLFISLCLICRTQTFSQKVSLEENCFTDKEIDTKATVLPKNYHGNNLKKLSNEIIRRESFSKDEFETTFQFRQRVEREKSKPLIAELGFKSVFAFTINNANFQYDADNKIMHTRLNTYSNHQWSLSCENKDQYKSFGSNWALSPKMPIENSLQNRQNFAKEIDEILRVDLSFEIEIEKAKKSKPNLRYLVITQLDPENGVYFTEGLSVSIQEIWIYDIATGEIFVKKYIAELLAKLKKNIEENIGEMPKAISFYENSQYEESISELKKILSNEPKNAEAQLLLGKIYLRNDDLKQAISSLRKALFWNNQLIDAHIFLGGIFLSKNDCEMAKKHIISASAIDDKNQEFIKLQKQIDEKCSLTSNGNKEGDIDVGSLTQFATKRNNPIYPKSARKLRITGVVRVELTIDENGHIENILSVSGPSELQQSAINAINKWKFKPFTENGKPKKIKGYVSFNFVL